MKKTSFTLASATALAALLLPTLALAVDATSLGASANASADANASVQTTAAPALSATASAALTRGKNHADQEIDRRVTSLNALVDKVNAMQNLSATDKSAIAGTLTAQANALTALKVKIDADADTATLKTDVASVTGSYRIYALVIPQGAIITAADRVVTVAGKLKLIGAKFDARLTAAAAAGNDVTTARATLTDYAAKINDAQTQAQAAVSGIVPLSPDQGDKTKMATNIAALKAARAQIVLAQKDLAAARLDANTIAKALRGMKVSAVATTTTQTTAGQ